MRYRQGLQGSKVVEQEPMDEDVAPAYSAQQNVFRRFVQEAHEVPGKLMGTPEQQTEDNVLNTRKSTAKQPTQEATSKSNDQSGFQPIAQDITQSSGLSDVQ